MRFSMSAVRLAPVRMSASPSPASDGASSCGYRTTVASSTSTTMRRASMSAPRAAASPVSSTLPVEATAAVARTRRSPSSGSAPSATIAPTTVARSRKAATTSSGSGSGSGAGSGSMLSRGTSMAGSREGFAAGMGREPPTGSPGSAPPTRSPSRASQPAARPCGPANAAAHDFHAAFSTLEPPFSASPARRSSSIRCRGMPTGQTSVQRPHRLEADGRSAWRPSRHSSGDTTAPIGPMYGDPYESPPAAV